MATKGRDSRGDAVRVVGLKRTVRDLKAIHPELVAEFKTIEREAATIVAGLARSMAPVGKAEQGDKHPGALRSSIRVGVTMFASSVMAGGAKVPYAPPIHWGWGKRGIKADKFLFHAMDIARPEVEHNFERSVQALVDRSMPAGRD